MKTTLIFFVFLIIGIIFCYNNMIITTIIFFVFLIAAIFIFFVLLIFGVNWVVTDSGKIIRDPRFKNWKCGIFQKSGPKQKKETHN